MVLVGLTANAQRIDIDPKIDVSDLAVKVETAIKRNIDIDIATEIKRAIKTDVKLKVKPNIDINLGRNKYEDSDKYQQTEQEIEIPLSKPGQRGKLIVDSHNGRINVSGYDGQTVKVKIIKYSKKVDKDKSRDGMRLVSTGGAGFEAEEYNNTVEIDKDSWGTRADFVIQIPRNFDLEIETYNNGHIWIEDVEGEVNAESYNGPITLNNIKGSASASTYNGAIEVQFSQLDADSPMAFSTYNGNVDITVPNGTKFTAKMKTNRDIYTDFDSFTLSNPEPIRRNTERGTGIKYEDWIEGDLNGGGPNVTMKTTNGNIYIRKGN